MRCVRCQAELNESPFCPNCGCDVTVQKRAYMVSNLYYNQGLEKAEIRDLSGAIDLLIRSLQFNKRNIQARNLLGLVYFETGEAVAALSEWVISENIQAEDNIATEYIARLQANANKLDTINQSIKKYNEALEACRSGHTDTAAIQLKKVLSQNPKLIKGYHLLALIYIHDKDYRKARRILRRAGRIDKTNSTTLRFLKEIDEQTGTSRPEFRWPAFGKKLDANEIRENSPEVFLSDNDVVIQPPAFRETSVLATLINLCFGLAVGAATVWFLVVPANTQRINQSANERIVSYSDQMSSMSAELTKLREDVADSEATVTSAQEKIEEAQAKVTNYENLLKVYSAYQDNNYDSAQNIFQNIDASTLSVEGRLLYDSIYDTVGTYLFNKYSSEGILDYEQGEFEEAVTLLEQAMSIKDEDYDVMSALAYCLRNVGRINDSIDLFNRIAELYPDTNRALNAAEMVERMQAGEFGTDQGSTGAYGSDAAQQDIQGDTPGEDTQQDDEPEDAQQGDDQEDTQQDNEDTGDEE